MALRKNPKVDLKLKYRRFFEISVIVSLLLITAAFKYFPDIQKQSVVIEPAQPIVNILDVAITNWDKKPPVPPKPPIPIEAPVDNVLEDIEITGTDINEKEPMLPPKPPIVEKEKIVEPEIPPFIAVEQMPEPIGGIQAIQSKVVYPEIAIRAGVEGRVFIKALVDENGFVYRTEVVKGIGAGCDEAAEAAVKATKFKPGMQRGKPVRVQVTIPILFQLKVFENSPGM